MSRFLMLAGALALALPDVLAAQRVPTRAEAVAFVRRAETRLDALGRHQQRAGWIMSTYITHDTEQLAADAGAAYAAAATSYALEARRFDRVRVDPVTRRKLDLIKRNLTAPAPADTAQAGELARLGASLEGDYGRGRWCPQPDRCLALGEIEKILASSRDPDSLRAAWTGWHDLARPWRPRYARFAELANLGARRVGYADAGMLWRDNYDMPPEQFAATMERLWQQVKPLYVQLHAYTRARLVERYGPSVVPPDGPIPAHLLGNMWSQDWSTIYPLVAPPGAAAGVNLDSALAARRTTAEGMVRYGENFFVSLGFDSLPATFWTRSMLVKPRDREVVCHASAWDLDNREDVRIKMCITPDAENFRVVHHELGHNYYQMAYADQPPTFQNGANDGFHEAIGDAIALSISPAYLRQLGLVDRVPDERADLPQLMQRALSGVAFLPWGYLVDAWRWKVFAGDVAPAAYNRAWWLLRREYQGVAPPAPRGDDTFDAGAKYHVVGNVPYARYFLAQILQYQFHRALCREAGWTGPLHRCSIYGNRKAGDKLKAMLAMGQSRPWPEALEALTGSRELDATAMLDYYRPLLTWLEERNRGVPVGW